MTQTSRDYSDSIEDIDCSLAPADKCIYDEMKRRLDQHLCFRDFIKKYAHGTIRNAFSRLKKKALIRLYCRSGPAFYVCSCSELTISSKLITVNRMGGGGKVFKRGCQLVVDFGSFVESLDWGQLAFVHDVRVEFDAVCMPGVSVDCGWCWSSKCHSWIRKFGDFEFPLTVQAYDTGRVQVSVKCSLKPIPFSFEGLTRLTAVLGELKGQLGWGNVPTVVDWIVTCWHYGKDSLNEVSGVSFNVTFQTWSRTLARIYMKSESKRIRVEEIQSPRRTVQDLFDTIMNNVDANQNE